MTRADQATLNQDGLPGDEAIRKQPLCWLWLWLRRLRPTTRGRSADRPVALDQGEGAVEGAAQGERVSARLRENQAALDTGQGRRGEPGDIRIGPKLAGLDHGHQAGSDIGLPAIEP